MFGHLKCLQFNVFTVYCTPSYLSYRERDEEPDGDGGQNHWAHEQRAQICARQVGWRRPRKGLGLFSLHPTCLVTSCCFPVCVCVCACVCECECACVSASLYATRDRVTLARTSVRVSAAAGWDSARVCAWVSFLFFSPSSTRLLSAPESSPRMGLPFFGWAYFYIVIICLFRLHWWGHCTSSWQTQWTASLIGYCAGLLPRYAIHLLFSVLQVQDLSAPGSSPRMSLPFVFHISKSQNARKISTR